MTKHRLIVLTFAALISAAVASPVFAVTGDQLARLRPEDPDNGIAFGRTVALFGDKALVGANSNSSRTRPGSAYLFQKGGGQWTQIAKFTASRGSRGDEFGARVALTNTHAFVGAPFDDEFGRDTGSVYVYSSDASGQWDEIAKIGASNPIGRAQFGFSVSLSQDTALVGAPIDALTGSAYLLREDGAGNWNQIAKLTASDGSSGDEFGYSVALTEGIAVIGARGDDDAGGRSGSAYIFQEDSLGNWTQTAKLTAADANGFDEFGFSVSVSNHTAIVGSVDDDDGGSNSGSAYVFQSEAAGSWTQTAKISADDAEQLDGFGASISLLGDTALIGGFRTEGAYLFRNDAENNWQQIAKLTSNETTSSDELGISVSLSGEAAIVGAHFQWHSGFGSAGSAYIFDVDSSIPEPSSSIIFASTLFALGLARGPRHKFDGVRRRIQPWSTSFNLKSRPS